jgi:phenylalanyl-tRNA synthetase alpha chain
MESFPREQYVILEGLGRLEGEIAVSELARNLGIDQALAAAGSQLLADVGLVELREIPYRELVLKEGAREVLAGGLPERRVLNALLAAGRPLALTDLPAVTGLTPAEVGGSLRQLAQKGWAIKEGGTLRAGPAAAGGATTKAEDEKALEALAARADRKAREEELVSICDLERALELLKGRRELLEVRTRKVRRVRLSPAGRARVAGGIREAKEIGQLTPELIRAGAWREASFKSYDVRLGVAPRHPGKAHPMQRIIADTRRVFLEMGFAEIASPLVESTFWNFDALFQPQDHPAREMQDTFYLERPARVALPADAGLVERVRRTHEDGGETGSLGWGYRWDPERARGTVLRTHTTAATIRAVAEDPKGPRKVFCVGRVFRREAIDYKHLPVFHQVDGIIIDEAATFANLLGTLAAFYHKMGFDRLEFRPGFFPYTEPSVEVFIWVEAKQDWFEMGGAGIFRPEVTEPLGCQVPVLAWGLGLERLAMLRYDILEMRALYQIDLEWLKEVPLCR